ncbi:MAG: hypothetical protein ACLVES_02850, partial [Faecalibacterium prausnitzii]
MTIAVGCTGSKHRSSHSHEDRGMRKAATSPASNTAILSLEDKHIMSCIPGKGGGAVRILSCFPN